MPNNDEAKARPGRRPLVELSKALNNGTDGLRNRAIGKFSLKTALEEKKKLPPLETKMEEPTVVRKAEEEDDVALDRLLLVQLDLSALTHQIEELVVQAFNLNAVSTNGRNEIDSFRNFLSETLSSMKPWTARLQKALSAPPKEPENVTELSQSVMSSRDDDDDGDDSILADSPDQSKLESLISPSPFVSWRANCTVERGRQLFLLTPLPISKSLSSKCRESSISVLEKMSSATAPLPSLHTVPQETFHPTPEESSKFIVLTKDAIEEENSFSSPVLVSKRECSMTMMTPCFKMSPPKSCTLLEPVSELSHWRDCHMRKATPFPVGIHSAAESSESSDDESSDGLLAKFPELLAIRYGQRPELGKKEKESSPDWFVSPPKSCILMEPLDEKKLTVTATDCKDANFLLINADPTQDISIETSKSEPLLALVESTPVWKEPESAFYKGKRPGENTLKKELWTRFQAASSFGFHLDSYVNNDTVKKGLIDQLDEVSFS